MSRRIIYEYHASIWTQYTSSAKYSPSSDRGYPCEADLNRDGVVNFRDNLFLMNDLGAALPAGQISAIDSPVGFAGYIIDDETGLYAVRNRTYCPGEGRWLERDPAGYVDGQHLYQYVQSSPTWKTDPLGMFAAATLDNCSNKRRRPGFTPSQNGCGPEDFPAVPDSFFWQVQFRVCCNDHDQCYQECGVSRNSCDQALVSCMKQRCFDEYPAGSQLGFLCELQADLYGAAVLLGGSDIDLPGIHAPV